MRQGNYLVADLALTYRCTVACTVLYRVGAALISFSYCLQFDVNKDGVFESHELLSRAAREMEAMGKEPSSSSVSRPGQMLRSTSLSAIQPSNLTPEELQSLKQRVKNSMARKGKQGGEAW